MSLRIIKPENRTLIILLQNYFNMFQEKKIKLIINEQILNVIIYIDIYIYTQLKLLRLKPIKNESLALNQHYRWINCN